MRDDDAMQDMADSVKLYGVLSPAIARPMPDGGYELVSGHRRKRACELAGLETMPVIVRELDDDAAAILVVDSNLQREGLLPSERAFAYKLKLEALRHQGEQRLLLDAMDSEQATTSLSQAQRLKQFSQRGELTAEVMRAIMSEEKKPEIDRITITGDRLRKYFPRSYTPKQMEETIIKLLEQWQKRRKREAER